MAAMLAALGGASIAQADSTIVYELTAKDGSKFEHTVSISGRWLRLDTLPKGNSDYIVMDMGRMMMFEVHDQDKSFQVTRMGRLYWPATNLTSPQFKPVAKKSAVSGVHCQPVNEMTSNEIKIAQHCMTAGGGLGFNAREMITLSRLFMSARRLGQNWPGVATPDERQVSLLSQGADGIKQMYKGVSHGWIDSTLFKIPVNYQRLKPDFPVAMPGK